MCRCSTSPGWNDCRGGRGGRHLKPTQHSLFARCISRGDAAWAIPNLSKAPSASGISAITELHTHQQSKRWSFSPAASTRGAHESCVAGSDLRDRCHHQRFWFTQGLIVMLGRQHEGVAALWLMAKNRRKIPLRCIPQFRIDVDDQHMCSVKSNIVHPRHMCWMIATVP